MLEVLTVGSHRTQLFDTKDQDLSDPVQRALRVFLVAGGVGSGGTSATDGAAWDAGTTAGTPLMAARDDTSPATLGENSLGVVRATLNRALHVNLRRADGSEGQPLPEGAATEATLAALAGEDFATQTTLAAFKAAFDARDLATADAQATGNASLASIASEDFATEATLAAVKTAIEIVDDWDESGRAKVNPIAGQAGVAAGAGAVGVNTQRVTLASDDPAVTSLAVLDDWDESDRAKVNLVAGQAGVDGDSGNKSAKTLRVVVATDQPALTNAQPIKQTSANLPTFAYGTPAQKSVTNTAANLADATSGFRKVTVYVPVAAVTGIYVNANGTATSSHFLMEPGMSRVFHTAQAISAIRAGATNVTVYVEEAT